MLVDVASAIAFRDRVTVEIFGHVISGEVVFANAKEVAVAFDTTPEIFEAIEAFEDFVLKAEEANEEQATDHGATALPATVDLGPDFWDLHLPIVDKDSFLSTRDDLDLLGMLLCLKAGRPIAVRSLGALSRVQVQGIDDLMLTAMPVSRNGFLLLPPDDLEPLDLAVARLGKLLDTSFTTVEPPKSGPAPTTAPTTDPTTDDLPLLRPDGGVVFKTHDQFVAQYPVNLSNGAIMARGAAPAHGSIVDVSLLIPEMDPIAVPGAKVMFTGDDRVGFLVPNPEAFRKAAAARLEKNAAAAAARGRRSSGRALPSYDHQARLRPRSSILALFELRRGDTDDLKAADGWYVGLMDRALRSGRDALLMLAGEQEELKVWIHASRVVAVERTPAVDKDLLGERLVSSRKLDSASLKRALSEAKKSRRPLGQVILWSGQVTRADVHRALRQQILDRVIIPCAWSSGQVTVGGWTLPPVDADLLPVSADAVTTALVRAELQSVQLAEVRQELATFDDRDVQVDLARILEGFRLTDRETRFFQRGAELKGGLASLLSVYSSRPLDAYRLILLGAALGFIRFSETSANGS